MKYTVKKVATISVTLDSSETIMFTKGGAHSLDLDSVFEENELDGCKLILNFQMERNQQGRFDFITGEADKHKEQFLKDLKEREESVKKALNP